MIKEKDMYVLKRVAIKGYDDVVGVMIKNSNNYYDLKVITIDGIVIPSNCSSIIKVSIVRGLDEEVRKAMNNYGKEQKARYKKIEKLKEELENLEKENENEEEKIKERIVKERGLMFSEDLNARLSESIEKLVPRGCHSTIRASSTLNAINVNISKDIRKYASPDEYSFLYLEYDRTLHMSSNKEYEELKTRYEKQLNVSKEATIKRLEKEYKCKIRVSSYLAIGDKDWLTYEYGILIKMNDGFDTSEKNLEKIKEIISKILK